MSSLASSGMTTIGFIKVDGPVNPAGIIGRDISQAGVWGIARMRVGYRGEPFRIRTIGAYSSGANMALGKILYLQYRERLATLTDDHGTAWSNLLVLGVQITDDPPILSGTGLVSGASHLLMAEWELQATA